MIALDLELSLEEEEYALQLDSDEFELSTDLSVEVKRIEGEKYTGDYTVTPKTHPQTLETAQKVLTADITVEAVPYYETSNLYGDTVYIASEV